MCFLKITFAVHDKVFYARANRNQTIYIAGCVGNLVLKLYYLVSKAVRIACCFSKLGFVLTV